MRRLVILALALSALAPACKRKQQIAVDTSEAKDIPREVALQKLQELLPTAVTVSSTVPKDTYKASEVKEWRVGNLGFEAVPASAKDQTLSVAYAEITSLRLDQSGKYYLAKIFSTRQPDKGKEHLVVTWTTQETAKQVVELLESLRQKR
jgi:hypothetical protein